MKNNTGKSLIGFFASLLLVLFSLPASAVVLSLQPSVQNAVPADNISLDLVISGLNVGSADSLGDFDININFDSAALSFLGYKLGSSLGNIAFFDAADYSSGDLGGGLVNISEVSFLSTVNLDALQSSSFTLATFDFRVDTLTAGSSTTVFLDKVKALGDGFGKALTLDSYTNATITNSSVSVPESSTFVLLIMGLLSFGATRRRSR